MIVITTPTGQIGRQTLENILDSAEPIRVIARDPARLPAHVRERVEVVPGTHDDLDVLDKAFAGADRVLLVVPPVPSADSVEGLYRAFTRPACEAIVSQGVTHVVQVSTLGRGTGRSGHLGAALASDELVSATGAHFRALRPPAFMENLLHQVQSIRSGTFELANDADRTLLTCATRDIATAAAELLLDDSWQGQGSVPVVSPDDLSPNDMARVMADVLGRPIRYEQLPLASYKATMMRYGASEAWAQGLADMAAATNEGFYDGEHGPRTVTSFRQWCADVLRPAVSAA